MTTLTQPPLSPQPVVPRPRAAAGPLTPARRVTFVVGALISLVTIAYGVTAIVAEGSQAVERLAFTIEPTGATFTVQTDTGDITVRPSDDDRVHVVRTASFGGRRPAFVEQPNGSGDRLVANCGAHWFMSDCSVDYEVAVPDGMSLQLRTDTGDVLANGVDGALDAASSTGDVEVRGVAGPLMLHSSTGDVNADAVRSDSVDVSSSTGDVTVRFADEPNAVSATSNTGDVSLYLPDGPYALTTDSDTGDVVLDVPSDPDSARTVLARTDTGDVELRPAG